MGRRVESGRECSKQKNDVYKALQARMRDQEEVSALTGGGGKKCGWSRQQWPDCEDLVNPVKESGLHPDCYPEPANGFKLGLS